MRIRAFRFDFAAVLKRLPVLLAALIVTSLPAAAAKRVALVVGNAAYESVPALANSINDAAAMRKALGEAGFDVVYRENADLAGFREAVESFTGKLEQAGPESAAVVFYAGHAVQLDGVNYLLTVDVKPKTQADVAAQSVSLGDILKSLDATGAGTKIVILDSCRDNPFAAVTASRGLAVALLDGGAHAPLGEAGLARVESRGGTLVAFSTSPGATAADGAGVHSPYTQAFLSHVREPGLPVEQLFRRVRLAVHDTTGGSQLPWETTSLTSEFSFVPAEAKLVAASEDAAPLLTRDPPRPTASTMRARSAAEAYQLAVYWDEPEIYRIYLEVHPDDLRALSVHRILSLRQEELAWALAVAAGDAEALRLFLRLYPGSFHANAALRLADAAPLPVLQLASVCEAPALRTIAVPPPRPAFPAPTTQPRRAERAAPRPASAAAPEAVRPARAVRPVAVRPRPVRPAIERRPVVRPRPESEFVDERPIRRPVVNPDAAIAIGIIGGHLLGGALQRGPRGEGGRGDVFRGESYPRGEPMRQPQGYRMQPMFR